jgi:hypothetical protein
MTDSDYLDLDQTPESWRSMMRWPHFRPGQRRTPGQAVLHAMPAALYMIVNVWLMVATFAWLFSAIPFLPDSSIFVFAAIMGVPALAVCWVILVRCIEVETMAS